MASFVGFDAIEATHQLAQVRPQFLSLYTPIFQVPLWLLDLWACLWVLLLCEIKRVQTRSCNTAQLKKGKPSK